MSQRLMDEIRRMKDELLNVADYAGAEAAKLRKDVLGIF
jgi:hypothetical protein